mmetsp:Transcript_13891/g.33134  ORF Transcript_13891/g.33134 Transcript_13891/m.33134 type:complete len:203 (-) Transcript_13891:388-996(-)
MKYLLLVLAQRLEPAHEDEALADVVAHGPDLIPPLDDLAALDRGDVQFLHEDSRDGMTPGLKEELVRLAARPECHLGDGRGRGETFQLLQMKCQLLVPPPAVVAVHLSKLFQNRTNLPLICLPFCHHAGQFPLRLGPLFVDQSGGVGDVGEMTLEGLVLGLESRVSGGRVLQPGFLLLAGGFRRGVGRRGGGIQVCGHGRRW